MLHKIVRPSIIFQYLFVVSSVFRCLIFMNSCHGTIKLRLVLVLLPRGARCHSPTMLFLHMSVRWISSYTCTSTSKTYMYRNTYIIEGYMMPRLSNKLYKVHVITEKRLKYNMSKIQVYCLNTLYIVWNVLDRVFRSNVMLQSSCPHLM